MKQDYLKKKKILLVDDEQEILYMVQGILAHEGYLNTRTAGTVREAMAAWKEWKPELVLLDVMLPDGDGFELLEAARAFSDIPVLFLSARGEDEDRFRGLELGADDYLVKPFLPKELLLRMTGILRRCYKEEEKEDLLRLAACALDFQRAEVVKGEHRIALTAKEYALLQVLARNAGRIVTIDMLCEAVWGDNPFGYENSLMAHIRRIREKIEENPSKPVSLITIKGLGYKLKVKE